MAWLAWYTCSMFDQLEALLLSYADILPLPVFAALASFVEEIVAPIPSGAVMLVIGSFASIQEYSLPLLLLLACVAATGKLLGSLVVYAIADKAEDVITMRFAKFLGITHEQIEAFGARLGNGWKDYAVLTLLRSLPFVPSALVSFGAGALKVSLRPFITATVIGSIIRDVTFLYLGYIGFAAAETLQERFSTWETVVFAIVAGLALLVFGYLCFRWIRRGRTSRRSS